MDERCNILVVNDHDERRRMLVNLIQREIKPQLCVEADSVDSASETLKRQSVSFAIVEIRPGSRKGIKLAESIKLRCPTLPILAVSIEQDNFKYVNNPDKEVKEDGLNRILSGIRYMNSLTKSGISGFTVAVNI